MACSPWPLTLSLTLAATLFLPAAAADLAVAARLLRVRCKATLAYLNGCGAVVRQQTRVRNRTPGRVAHLDAQSDAEREEPLATSRVQASSAETRLSSRESLAWRSSFAADKSRPSVAGSVQSSVGGATSRRAADALSLFLSLAHRTTGRKRQQSDDCSASDSTVGGGGRSSASLRPEGSGVAFVRRKAFESTAPAVPRRAFAHSTSSGSSSGLSTVSTSATAGGATSRRSPMARHIRGILVPDAAAPTENVSKEGGLQGCIEPHTRAEARVRGSIVGGPAAHAQQVSAQQDAADGSSTARVAALRPGGSSSLDVGSKAAVNRWLAAAHAVASGPVAEGTATAACFVAPAAAHAHGHEPGKPVGHDAASKMQLRCAQVRHMARPVAEGEGHPEEEGAPSILAAAHEAPWRSDVRNPRGSILGNSSSLPPAAAATAASASAEEVQPWQQEESGAAAQIVHTPQRHTASQLDGSERTQQSGESGCALAAYSAPLPPATGSTAPAARRTLVRLQALRQRHMGELWSAAGWLFGTSVVLAVVFGLYAHERRSPKQVALVVAVQALRVAAMWGVFPLRRVGTVGCAVDLEELGLLGLATSLLILDEKAPRALQTVMIWSFPAVIATMMIGDGVQSGWAGLKVLCTAGKRAWVRLSVLTANCCNKRIHPA